MDAVIPSLLAGLEGDSKQAGQALEGLRVILGVRPGTLASMLPKLLHAPLHSSALRALGSLAEAAGEDHKSRFRICQIKHLALNQLSPFK